MNPAEPNLPGVQFLDAAVEIANSLGTRERDETMSAAAINYSALGLLDDALKSADEISDSFLRDTALTQIAVNAVATEADADPLSLIESIEDQGNQNLALEEIAVKYAEHRLFDQALEVCERLDDRDSALARIVKIIGTENSLERSEELAQQINETGVRTTCLIELAGIAGTNNHVDQARNILLAAENDAQADSQYVENHVYQLIAIADVYEELGQRENVKEILLRAFQLCDEIEGATLDLEKTLARDVALTHVAAGFARSRHYDQADLVSEKIENPFKFAEASIQQAIAHHEDGNEAQALQILSEARELITAEPCYGPGSLFLRDAAYGELAVAYATLQDFKKGLEEALLISNPEQQLKTLIQLGRSAGVAGFTDSIFEIHGVLTHEYARATYLISVSEALLKSGNKELAVRLLLRALEDADKIQRIDQRSLMLIQISFGLIAGELESKANEILSTVLSTAVKLEDGHQQAQILLALAEQYQRHARQLSENEKQILENIAV